ncbi:hypothetical protein VTK26DRAFT_2211 [Humicola hyalothermophila]
MASLGGNLISPPEVIITSPKCLFAGIAGVLFFSIGLHKLSNRTSRDGANGDLGLLRSLLLFCYSCFLKPHSGGDKGTQQDALESFYAGQASVYDVTRKALLKGREEMLALAAAQLRSKAAEVDGSDRRKRIWVDVGGGTGWNIEAMAEHLNVPEFFSSIYLVDFSPSLCEVARKRFARLGWTNVKVICEDARKFRLEDYEDNHSGSLSPPPRPSASYLDQLRPSREGADLVTMSYSLSMMVGGPPTHSE